MNAERPRYRFHTTLPALLMLFVCGMAHAQETVFTIWKSDEKKADEYYAAKDYKHAAELYETITARTNTERYVLPLARSYYYLNQPIEANRWYARFLRQNTSLPANDLYYYAETLTATRRYDEAIKYYNQYQQAKSKDPQVMKKIWRLKNRDFLYEDSVHYAIKRLSINSTASDVCAVPYNDGFVFACNHSRRPNESAPYQWQYVRRVSEPLGADAVAYYERAGAFGKSLGARYQQGPVCFYKNQQNMAYIASGEPSSTDGNKRNLQLLFAERVGDMWKQTASFPYNERSYSIKAVAVREDGSKLYFASDMPGGRGGTDIYASTFKNGQWQKPVNLGELINTPGDESFPWLVGNMLYFASNGHPGLGGYDIFTAVVSDSDVTEPQNVGYPINTNADDFGITLAADGAHGFVTSNRYNNTDDIYELTIDLQSYPFSISGVLKYKEESWNNSTDLKLLPNAQLFLIDNVKNIVVQTADSNGAGEFSLTIPYFSQYRIRVVGDKDGEEAFVSLDLSKKRNADNKYEIVVVKNAFKKTY